MKNYKMGVVKSDDQDFGNKYSINLMDKDGTDTATVGYRPKNFHGVNALIQTGDDEYSLMREDDGHFWTHAILTRELIGELKGQLEKIREGIILKPNWKFSFTRAFIHHRVHKHFSSDIEMRAGNRPLVHIDVKGIGNRKDGENTEMIFDISWVDDLLKVLDINNWKEKGI